MGEMKYKDCIFCGKPGIKAWGHMHSENGGLVTVWFCQNCYMEPEHMSMYSIDKVIESPCCETGKGTRSYHRKIKPFLSYERLEVTASHDACFGKCIYEEPFEELFYMELIGTK